MWVVALAAVMYLVKHSSEASGDEGSRGVLIRRQGLFVWWFDFVVWLRLVLNVLLVPLTATDAHDGLESGLIGVVF
jgi:hypothetical protein